MPEPRYEDTTTIAKPGPHVHQQEHHALRSQAGTDPGVPEGVEPWDDGAGE